MIALDAGSRWVKVARLIDGESQVAGFPRRRWEKVALIDTPAFYRDYCVEGQAGKIVNLEAFGLETSTRIVATGYGRNSEALSSVKQINEILAHAAGAAYLSGEEHFSLLDIGGQDTKVALVRDGEVEEIETNDRCAASCGRFIENMAAMIGMSFEEISTYYLDPHPLSSTCAVFAETELVELLAKGIPEASIAAGVNLSVFRKVEPMLGRLPSSKIVFSGGVARSEGLRRIIEEQMSVKVIQLPDPEFTGAVGCLILGGDE